MPTSKSAKKNVRQDAVLRMRNRDKKSALRTQIKKFVVAVKKNELEEAEKNLTLATKKLDKIAANVILFDGHNKFLYLGSQGRFFVSVSHPKYSILSYIFLRRFAGWH